MLVIRGLAPRMAYRIAGAFNVHGVCRIRCLYPEGEEWREAYATPGPAAFADFGTAERGEIRLQLGRAVRPMQKGEGFGALLHLRVRLLGPAG